MKKTQELIDYQKESFKKVIERLCRKKDASLYSIFAEGFRAGHNYANRISEEKEGK